MAGVLPLFLTRVTPNLQISTPASVGLAFENVVLTPMDQPIRIDAWWMPAEKPRATMLFVHGGGGDRVGLRFGQIDFYKVMHDRRVSVLAINLRNHGTSGQSSSGRMTFGREERFDVAAGQNWIKAKHPDLPLYATGISMGGATLVHAAAAGVVFERMIFFDPMLDNREVMQRATSAKLGGPVWLWGMTARIGHWLANERQGLDDPKNVTKKSKIPTLIITDQDDFVALPEHAAQLSLENPTIKHLALGVAGAKPSSVPMDGMVGHVRAFQRHPDRVLAAVDQFLSLDQPASPTPQ